jgi:hypothetical protein
MADKDFVVKNGLVVNTNVLVVNGSNVGIGTTTPDTTFTVAGVANLQANVNFTGAEVNTTANVTFFGNVHTKNNVYIDKKLYVGNTATMVQDLPTIIQAVDNFNGFVMVSSQNLSQLDDACADLLIYADNTNGLSNFNDLGINNSRFDGRIHRIIVNSVANSWSLGETVFQKNGAGANIAVGQIRDIVSINSTATSLKIRVSEDDGLPTYVGMANFANTAGSNLAIRAVTSAANADILHAVAFFSPAANTLSRRNYAFTIGKRGDGYLYNANSALTIGTTAGGIRSTTVTVPTTFSAGANTITVDSGNSVNDALIANSVTLDMDVTGTGIDTGTYVTSMINSTAFRISKNTTGTGSGTITLRDEFYDLTEANNPIIFHVGGMMAKDEIARFSGTGNFTIGPYTTSRNAKLTVNGTANLVGQVNAGANLNVVGNINSAANVYASRGIFTTAANIGIVAISTTAVDVGANVDLDASGLKISGNTLIPSINISGGNITSGNDSIANTPTVRLVNSVSSANLNASGLDSGGISINSLGSTINVGSNVWINATTIAIGNATANVVIAPSDPAWVLSVKGDARVNGNLLVKGDATVNGALIFANTVSVNGDFTPAANDSFDLGNSSFQWGASYIKILNVPQNGNVVVGNSTLNSVMNFNSVMVLNSTGSFANLSIGGVTAGNTTVNGQYTSAGARLGNTTSNAVLNSTSLVIGTSSVNSTINSSAFTGNVFAVSVNTTSLNATSVNSTSINSTSANVSSLTAGFANATSINSTSVNATSINSTSMNAATINASTFNATTNVVVGGVYTNTTAFTGNVVATSVRSTTINATSSNVTTANANLVTATNVHATTINAATFQVGSAFKANTTDVITANLTVSGNLTVTGTTTYLNTTTLDVQDLNITLAKGVASAVAADGAGITVDGANATITYVNAGNTWLSNINFAVGNSVSNVNINSTAFVGNVIATRLTGNLVGNVTATTITGNLTGNVVATTITGNLTGNVAATTISGNLTSSTVAATANVTTNTVWATNVYSTFANATTINTGLVQTTNVYATFSNSSTVNATTSNVTTANAARFQVGATFSANTTVVNSIAYHVGTRIVANSTTVNATHLGGYPVEDFLRSGGVSGGVVNLADGGTNNAITASAGALAYSTANKIQLTSVGATNQVLISQGTSAPTWALQSSLSVGYATTAGSATTAGTATSATSATTATTATSATTATNLAGGGAGQLAYQTGSGATTFLSTGTAGYVLTSQGAGSPPTWTAVSTTATSATNLAGGGAGRIAYQTGSGATAFTTAGTSGQVLTSAGGGAPTWTTVGNVVSRDITINSDGPSGGVNGDLWLQI